MDLNVIADRLDGVRLAVIDQTNQLSQLKDAVSKLESMRAVDFERLLSRSEVNRVGLEDLRKAEEYNRITESEGLRDVKKLHADELAILTKKVGELSYRMGILVAANGFLGSVAVIYVAGHLLRVFP